MKNEFPNWLDNASVVLLLLNLPLIILESIPSVALSLQLTVLEWVFTGLFTLEYLIRIGLASQKSRYIFSTGGIIDFVAVLPQYILVFFPGAGGVFLVRLLRFVRLVSRSFKAAKRVASMVRQTVGLSKHFSPQEKIVREDHMSRLHFPATYFLGVPLAILTGLLAIYFEDVIWVGFPIPTILLYVAFSAIVIVILRKELFIQTHKYAVSNHRILKSSALFHVDVVSINLDHITDITLQQTFIERIFNVGSIDARTSGETVNLHLEGIRNPQQLKQFIEQILHHKRRQQTPPQQQV